MITTHKELVPPLRSFQHNITSSLAAYPELSFPNSLGHFRDSPDCPEFSFEKPLMQMPHTLLDNAFEAAKDTTGGYYEPGMEGFESGFSLYIHLPKQGCIAPTMLKATLRYQHSIVLPKSDWQMKWKRARPRFDSTLAEGSYSVTRYPMEAAEIVFASWQEHSPWQMQTHDWRRAGDYTTDITDSLNHDLNHHSLEGVLGIISMQIALSVQELGESR